MSTYVPLCCKRSVIFRNVFYIKAVTLFKNHSKLPLQINENHDWFSIFPCPCITIIQNKCETLCFTQAFVLSNKNNSGHLYYYLHFKLLLETWCIIIEIWLILIIDIAIFFFYKNNFFFFFFFIKAIPFIFKHWEFLYNNKEK